MQRLIGILALIIINCNICTAQKRTNVWHFGTGIGINFNTVPPSPITGTPFFALEGCSSISSPTTGQILFFTNGKVVLNKNYQVMPTMFANNSPLFGGLSSTQGCVIVPNPADTNLYYIFTTAQENEGDLCYSVVDMSLNGGLGDVISFNNVLMTNTTEMLCAVGNCDNSVYWVCAHQFGNDKFYAYKITAAGISAPVITAIGAPIINNSGQGYEAISTLKFNQQGTQLAQVSYWSSLISFYNFNFNTGIISNYNNAGSVPGVYGGNFSPDGSKFYVTAPNFQSATASVIYRYNMLAGSNAAITNSRTTIDSTADLCSTMQLGPDGKFYIQNISTNYIMTIDNVNSFNPIINPQAINFSPYPNFLNFCMPNFVESFLKVNTNLPNNYTLTYTTCEGIFDISFNNVISSTPNSVTWYFGDNANTSSTQANATFTYNNTGTYQVKLVYANECGALDTLSQTLQVGINNDTIKILTPDTTYCNAPVATLINCISNSNTISWQPATGLSCTNCLNPIATPTTSTVYTVTVGNISGCTATDVITINIDTAIAIANASANTICQGQALQLTQLSNTIAQNYQWSLGNGITLNGANQTYTYSTAGNYTIVLQATTALGCTALQNLPINVVPINSGSLQLSSNNICLGDSVTIIANTSNSMANYIVDLNNGILLQNISNTTYNYNKAGTYTLSLVINNTNCPPFNTQQILNVQSLPLLNLGPDTAICGTTNQNIVLANTFTQAGSYVWSNGSNNNTITINSPNTYSCTLTSQGCAVSDSINVINKCELNIPNAFTPNADGLNDYFWPVDIATTGAKSISINIYNRLGQNVYTSNSILSKGWDGTYNNQVATTDVYFYLIKVVYANSTSKSYSGDVSLVR
jgi:gliding motility-associated-like protein